MRHLLASLRFVVASMLICAGVYVAAIWAVATAIVPDSARGSLLRSPEGVVVGSRMIAQKFEDARYFWPRPSAVDYNGAGAGGSNKSPTSADLAARAAETVAQYGATESRPLPAEMAAASGGGLDPHITERAALYQADRVAAARGLNADAVRKLIDGQAFRSGGFFASERLVNVLEINLALDAQGKTRGGVSAAQE